MSPDNPGMLGASLASSGAPNAALNEIDVALFGTGVASLVAAFSLISEGKSVLLLNPQWDFFYENSELPLDPLWPIRPSALSSSRLLNGSPERSLSVLRPNYPGSIEFWPDSGKEGFHDMKAPHLRLRDWVWVRSSESEWEVMENMYLEASDAGLSPRVLEGVTVPHTFPGHASKRPAEGMRGILVPRLCDVDVSRYRNGLLEFIQERIGPGRLRMGVSQLTLTPEGIHFYAGGAPRRIRLREKLLVFWTPQLTPWVVNQAKENGVDFSKPSGIRLWEEWSLISREILDTGVVGIFEDLVVWAEAEGIPGLDTKRLSVLRPGPLVEWQGGVSGEIPWASSGSWDALSKLFHDFLGWEYFSVRALRPRAIFEWEENFVFKENAWEFSKGAIPVRIVAGCDGPLVDVVRRAREACA